MSSTTSGLATTSEINEADVALPVCIPGLQGLPIQITGWSGFTERDSIVVPNDIHCQFIESTNLHSNTFFMNGTQYFVSELDITQPKQEGLLDASIKPFGEIHIWGKPTTTTLEQSSIALLTIPVSESSDGNEAGRKLENFRGKISDLLPQEKDVEIVKYTTCVETQKSTIIVHVAYWTVGIILRTEYKEKHFNKKLRKFGIPVSLLNGDQVLTTYEQYNDEHRTKTKRVYKMSTDNNYSIPYSISILLSAVSPEFQKGFRLIRDFSIEKGGKSKDLDTSSYKCIAINRSRDIKDGRLTVDPRTGKSLSEENQEAETITNASLELNNKPSGTGYMTILTILGIILGCCGIALIVYFIQYLISTRSTAGLAPVPLNVQAMANLAEKGTLGTATAAAATAATAATATASSTAKNLAGAMNNATSSLGSSNLNTASNLANAMNNATVSISTK